MPNPVEQIVALAKKGDRRILLGGAAVIGGGVGLIVYLRRRGGGGGGFAVLPNAPAPDGGEASGGGGTGGDLSSLLDYGMGLETPTLPELAAAETTGLYAESALPNLAGTAPIALPELPTLAELSASPYFGAYPLPDLPVLQPSSYTGGSYGNDLGASATLPAVSGALSAFRNEPAPTIQQPVSTHEITAEVYTPAAISPVTTREIAAETGFHVPTTREIAEQYSAAQAAGRAYQQQVQARSMAADVYIPGQGAVLGGVHESISDYYSRAANLVQSVAAARQADASAAIARMSNVGNYSAPTARSAYSPPTAQTARAETYTSPVRTAAAESYTPKARDYAEPAARSGLVVKPDSAKARLA